MDRIQADQIIQPKPTCEMRKEKTKTEGVALYGIKDFICSTSFVDIETFYAGKQRQAKKLRTGQESKNGWVTR